MKKFKKILALTTCTIATLGILAGASYARTIGTFSFSTVTGSSFSFTSTVTKSSNNSVPGVINTTSGANGGYVQNSRALDVGIGRNNGYAWVFAGRNTNVPAYTRTNISYYSDVSNLQGYGVQMAISLNNKSITSPHTVVGSWSPDAY